MVIELAILRYRNPDGSIHYGLRLNDCLGRMEEIIPQLESFEHLCTTIGEAIAEWCRPRRKPPANLQVIIHDESVKEGVLQLPHGAMPLTFPDNEKEFLSLVAVTATAGVAA